jgi:hypothetical protein
MLSVVYAERHDIKHNLIKDNNKYMTEHNINNIIAQHCYAECRLC